MRVRDLKITHQKLKSMLAYDQDTGIFTWVSSPSYKIKEGQPAGSIKGGYIRIRLLGKEYRAHRLAWFYVYGIWPENLIDHIDGDGLNNSISNLRLATVTENNRNKKMYSNNTSGVKGVYWDAKADNWRVRIRVDCVNVEVGRFDDLSEASDAANSFRKEIHKNFYSDQRA